MKKIIAFFATFSLIFSLLIFYSCDLKPEENPDDTVTTFTNSSWFFDFDGTVDGGDAYDVIKSSVDGKIYICGAFLHVNDDWDMKNLTRWLPSSNTWEQVPGIDYYHSNFIRCVTEDEEGNLYFGGDFSSIGGISAGRVGKFDVAAGTWSNLRDIDFYIEEEQYGPISGGVYAVQYLDNYIYIGGGIFNSDSVELRYIRRYNLTTKKWEAVGTGLNGRVRCFTTDGNGNLYVGGEFTEAGGVSANYVAKWDGTSWSALDNGTDDFVLDLAYDAGNLYVAGSFKNVGTDIRSQGIAKWNGSGWEAMSKGVYSLAGTNYSVQGVAVDNDGLVYIGGFFDRKYSDDDTLNHVGVFSQGEWRQLGDGLATSSTQGVIGMYADGNDIYFVGYFTRGTGDPNDKVNTAIWKK